MKRPVDLAGSGLRLLSDDELERVGGGTTVVSDDPIIVTAILTLDSGATGSGGANSEGSSYTMDDRPNNEAGPVNPIPVANETPCVTASPEGYSLSEINNLAKKMAMDIAALNDGSWEYGGIIYGVEGRIGVTGIVTQQNISQVAYPINQVPAGAVILALVHNQPNQHTTDESWPSDVDWDLYENLQDGDIQLPREITVDPKMLMYVYTDEDFETRVYDKNDKDAENEQCTL